MRRGKAGCDLLDRAGACRAQPGFIVTVLCVNDSVPCSLVLAPVQAGVVPLNECRSRDDDARNLKG